jgi:two-component system NtrC family sensor kinase
MSRLRKILAVSFRAKVLLPVIAVMVSLIAITAWVVNQRITRQVENDSRTALATANDAFRYFQSYRMEALLRRFQDLPSQPYYHAAFMTRDGVTLREPLSRLRDQQGVDIVLFNTEPGEAIQSSKRDALISVSDFESRSVPVIKQALRGEEKTDIIQVGDKLYDVVALPAFDTYGGLSGVVTLGCRINREAFEEPSRLTHSEFVLLANDQIVVSTISVPDANARFPDLFKQFASAPEKTKAALPIKNELIGNEHYYCSGGRLASLNDSGQIGYLLLYSYEQPLRALQTTQQILLIASAVAILLGSAIVCFLVGKVTQPLRELRDSAEAVSRGDFSRHVKVRSDDECGELAQVFNQMTHNLKNSLEELELTVETLKSTQAQLIQSEKLSGIGEFIAGVAHELNNPLTSVMGFSELLQQAEFDPKYKRHVELIHKSAMRCQKIVQALLSFARRRAPERKPACLNSLIEAALEILQYQLRTSNVEAILKFDPHLPQAMVDAHQLQQVFVNLINNARQAIESHQPKGWIKITTETRGETVRVIIQDNGPGISEENLSKIFDPFFTTKEVGKGTGLGLSLCYGIIKEHGGTVTPRSKPGDGATFIIELPVTHEADEADKTDEEDSFARTNMTDEREGIGKRVLVIDDEEPILHMVREALTPRGYEVDVALDGENGLRQLSRRKYDLTVCDWKMPGLNGQQVYERLQVINPGLSSRMIFITGDVINNRTRKFLAQQNKICLPKPFSIAEFRTAIKKVLSAE